MKAKSRSVKSESPAVPVGEILDGKKKGKVSIRGWVHRKRESKKIIFLLIRDDSGVIQCAVKDDHKSWEDAQEVTVESSVRIKGEVSKDKRAPGGYEIAIDKLEIVGLAERFPIARDTSEEFTRDMRHLWVRSTRLTQIFKVRSEIFGALRDFYKSRGYYEIQSPIFTKAACEGGTTLFEVKYFDDKAYLSQSWQLYAEAMLPALQKIYTIAPSFRAEKSRTRRHVTEYWHHEMETAWISFDGLLEFQEDMIIYLAKHVMKHCKKELKELGRDTKDLKALKKPFKRMKYAEAIKELGLKWGDDLTDKQERKLVDEFGKPLFLTHFPREMKAFYMEPDPDDPKTVLAVDLLLPGVGETTGGSCRIVKKEDLEDSMKIYELDPKDYAWYMDLRRYGTIPHGGFGLGIERLVMWLTGTEHIMDTLPFPRTMTRIYP